MFPQIGDKFFCGRAKGLPAAPGEDTWSLQRWGERAAGDDLRIPEIDGSSDEKGKGQAGMDHNTAVGGEV